jgi:hypothetical protein
MGYIKEPKGIDFIIKSEPLTEDERKTISLFIENDKAKNLAKRIGKKSAQRTKKLLCNFNPSYL